MALSRETLISMVKNEYPSSYSAEVEKMSHEDLMGLLDYLDSIKGKADGGAIGIEVLFKDKMAKGGRVGFQIGGWADNLEGEAKAIYDSMTAYGASDEEIQSKLQTQNLWSPDAAGSVNTGQVTGIINQDLGGNRFNEPRGPESYTQTWTSEGIPAAAQSTSFINDPASVAAFNQKIYDKMSRDADIFQTGTSKFPGELGYEKAPEYMDKDLWTGLNKFSQEDFMAQNPQYFSQGNVQPERTGLMGVWDKTMGMWDKTKDFFSGLGSPRIRGTLGTRLANQPRIPLPSAIAGWSMSPFNEKSRNYNENLIGQLNFLEGQEGLIGRDQAGHLKYGPESVLAGKNVISLFGTNDYEQALRDYITKMESYKRQTDHRKNQKRKAELELAALLENQNKGGDGGTTTTGGSDGGPGSWGGHGSVEAYDKSQADTYARAVDRHRGTTSSTDKWNEDNAWFARGGLASMFTRRR